MTSGPIAIIRSLLDRQTGLSPRQDAARQFQRTVGPDLPEQPHRLNAPPAAPANDDVPGARQRIQVLADSTRWDEPGADDVAGPELVRLADVEGQSSARKEAPGSNRADFRDRRDGVVNHQQVTSTAGMEPSAT
jgi:hypothetical protein